MDKLPRAQPGPLRKAFKVLGDPSEFIELQQAAVRQQAASVPPPPEPEPVRETVQNAAQEDFPEDVWEAAKQSEDDGEAILKSYREVVHLREMAQEHVSTLRNGSLSGTSGRPFGGKLPPPASQQLPPLQGSTMHKTISRQLIDKRDAKSLARYDLAEEEWADIVQGLAGRTARPAEELAMARGPEWRERMETLAAVSRALPLQDRGGGPDTWNMSLRGAWERIVPLGSMFSGLFVTIRDTPPADAKSARKMGAAGLTGKAGDKLTRVGRPLDPLPPVTALPRPMSGQPTPPGSAAAATAAWGTISGRGWAGGTATLGRSLTRRGRDWKSGQVLTQRLNQYAAAIHRNFPYQPHMPSLAITGQGVAEMLATLAGTPVTLPDAELHLAITDPDRYAAYCEARTRGAAAAAAAAEERQAQEAREAAAKEAAIRGTYPGPHVALSTPHLLLQAPAPGGKDSAPITLTNTGTTALTFAWHRVPAPPATLATRPPPAPTAAAALSSPAPPPLPCFQVALAEGVLLPGHTHTAHVLFTPTAPGVFAETWELRAHPEVTGEGGGPVVLAVRGLGTPEDGSGVARAAFADALAEAEKMRKVRAAVDRLVADVAPLPEEYTPDVLQEEETAFDATNGGVWPPLYFPGPEAHAALRALYDQARTALAAAMAPPPPPDDDPKKAKKATSARAKDTPPPTPPPQPPFPMVWGGSMHEVQAIIADLAALQPEQAQPLQAALDAGLAAQRVHVPASARTLIRHAMRAALGRVIDAVASKLDAVHVDYEQRLAEAKAAEEAAAAAGAAASAAPPAAAVGPQWLADKCRVGAKAQVKGLVHALYEEVGREKGAIGDWLEARIAEVDARIASHTAAATGGAGAGSEGETDPVLTQLYWDRFALLREWNRMGVPPRGDIR